MMTSARFWRSALIALAALIGAICMRTWQQPISLPAAAPDRFRPPSSEGPTVPAWLPADPLSKFGNAAERPLFHWTRRPLPPRPTPQTTAAAAPIAPPPLPNLTLRGAIITSERRMAIVEKPGEPDYLRLFEGQSLDGWTVIKVERSKAFLTSGVQKMELNLALPDNR
ncbi:hypothetical protein [Hyphomicrobium sp. ghe19]|uniref:hypothetical protein n=1 Tax=Hyphomicrobium sp. ghe19 TaxID=2682968 RepID=UPI0030D0F211